MSHTKRIVLILIVVVMLIPIAFFLSLRLGPTGPVPANPQATLNAAHADLDENAADLYAAAHAALVGDERAVQKALGEHESNTPLPEIVHEYVAQNAEALEFIRQAALVKDCWFTLALNDPIGTQDYLGDLRSLARLVSLAGDVAAEDHDWSAVAESVCLGSTLARHVDQNPMLLSRLVALACQSLAIDDMLEPLNWDDFPATERYAYMERVLPTLEPLRPMTEVMRQERDDSVWLYSAATSTVPAPVRFLLPAKRYAGEIDLAMKPYFELLELPVYEQTDPGHTLRQQIETLENQTPTMFSVRSFVRTLVASYSRAIELHNRLTAEQRGTRTVLELFRIHVSTGEFPATLDTVTGEFTVDPYSGQPFVYRPAGDSFTLYSLGLDRDDDGGIHAERFGEQFDADPDGDHVFWPIPD